MNTIKPIHPFAARMAPEIAFEALNNLPQDAIVLDQMSGSGTVLRTVSELGYKGYGFDLDPLAILMGKAWTAKISKDNFIKRARIIIRKAKNLTSNVIILPWIDDDIETKNFIDFWFASDQIDALRRLSYLLNKHDKGYAPLYKIALSRIIITKQRGASLAADVSHSRPHKVRHTNDFDVFVEFEKSCIKVASLIASDKLNGKISVNRGDARKIVALKKESVDCIITSPPYLNALDYMRGHKLSLVWLGYRICDLAQIRGNSVGAEKALSEMNQYHCAKAIVDNLSHIDALSARKLNMVYRYAVDMINIFKEACRVLKPNSLATFVIGNSCLEGVYIENTKIAEEAAKLYGLKLISNKVREIPQNKRYLPPPDKRDGSSLKLRMRTENIMIFRKGTYGGFN